MIAHGPNTCPNATSPAHRPRMTPNAKWLLNTASQTAQEGGYLPYYRLLDLAPDLDAALASTPRHHNAFADLEHLAAVSIAETLSQIPILTARFWRTLSLHNNICEAASLLLNEEYDCIHHRLDEELTFFGLVQDPETRFENIFPRLWRGPRLTYSGQVQDQIDPNVRASLIAKIACGDITAETTGIRPAQLSQLMTMLDHNQTEIHQRRSARSTQHA